jgi:peptide/nickel transport system substrate-binding protein
MSAAPTRPRKRLHRTLALAAILPLTLAACSSAVGEQSEPKSDGAVVEGGTLRVGTFMDIQPTILYAMLFQSFNGNVLETLVDYPLDSLEPQPRLATEWELSEDGTQVRLALQPGVTFHSGRELTSADVEFSIKAAADPVNVAPIARSAAVVTKFDTSKPDEITLTLAHPISNLFDVLAAVPIVDSESAAGLKDGSKIIGTGPFVFESWTPGSEYVFARNDDYWGEKALLDEVQFKVIPDPQALTSQLRAGQLDVVSGASNRDAQQLESDPKYVVETVEGSGGGTYLGTNVTDPALKDVRVRRALAHAIDQERIAEEVYLGYGRGGDLPWTSDSPIYDAELDDYYPYDLDRSKELLAEAGVEGLKLPLSYAAENPTQGAIAQIIQSDLASIGVELKLVPRPMAELSQLGAVPGGIEGLWLNGHQWSNFSPATIPVSAYAFNSEQNISNFDDPAYKAAARNAWATTPEKAAASEVYPQLAKAFLDSAFVNEVFVSTGVRVSSTNVHDLASGKTIALGLAEAYVTK